MYLPHPSDHRSEQTLPLLRNKLASDHQQPVKPVETIGFGSAAIWRRCDQLDALLLKAGHFYWFALDTFEHKAACPMLPLAAAIAPEQYTWSPLTLEASSCFFMVYMTARWFFMVAWIWKA
ncbi:hypothetical protein [Ferrimonas pelagia]|uniref:hypothetical protein n=1 Tax=Ferrimonas pelagia TaxID=1177826 RepID=UPI0031E60686